MAGALLKLTKANSPAVLFSRRVTTTTRKRLKQHPYQNDRNDPHNKDFAEARRKFMWKKSYWPKSKMAARPIWSKYKVWYKF